jgi:hypothetical protein
VEAHFGPFGDIANHDARSVHGVQRKYHRLENHFQPTQWNSSVTRVLWNLVTISLETVFVLLQDRCRVCAKRTISIEIVLDASDCTPWF